MNEYSCLVAPVSKCIHGLKGILSELYSPHVKVHYFSFLLHFGWVCFEKEVWKFPYKERNCSLISTIADLCSIGYSFAVQYRMGIIYL
jgi:hypothetical protein